MRRTGGFGGGALEATNSIEKLIINEINKNISVNSEQQSEYDDIKLYLEVLTLPERINAKRILVGFLSGQNNQLSQGARKLIEPIRFPSAPSNEDLQQFRQIVDKGLAKLKEIESVQQAQNRRGLLSKEHRNPSGQLPATPAINRQILARVFDPGFGEGHNMREITRQELLALRKMGATGELVIGDDEEAGAQEPMRRGVEISSPSPQQQVGAAWVNAPVGMSVMQAVEAWGDQSGMARANQRPSSAAGPAARDNNPNRASSAGAGVRESAQRALVSEGEQLLAKNLIKELGRQLELIRTLTESTKEDLNLYSDSAKERLRATSSPQGMRTTNHLNRENREKDEIISGFGDRIQQLEKLLQTNLTVLGSMHRAQTLATQIISGELNPTGKAKELEKLQVDLSKQIKKFEQERERQQQALAKEREKFEQEQKQKERDLRAQQEELAKERANFTEVQKNQDALEKLRKEDAQNRELRLRDLESQIEQQQRALKAEEMRLSLDAEQQKKEDQLRLRKIEEATKALDVKMQALIQKEEEQRENREGIERDIQKLQELQTSHDRSKHLIQSTRSENEGLKARNEELEQLLKDSEAKKARVEAEKRAAEQEKRVALEAQARLEQAKADAEKRAEQARQEAERAKADAEKRVEEARQTASSAIKNNKALIDQKTSQELIIDELRREKKGLEKQLEALQQSQNSSQQGKDQQLADLQTQLAQARQEAEAQKRVVQEAKQQAERAKADAEAEKARHQTQVDAEKARHQAELREAEAQRRDAEAKNARLQTQLTQVTAQNTQLQKELEELRRNQGQESDEVRQENVRLQAQLEKEKRVALEAQARAEAEKAKNAALREEHQRALEAQRRDAEQARQEAERARQVQQQAEARLREELARSQRKAEAEGVRVAEAEAVSAGLQTQLAQAQSEAQEAQARAEAENARLQTELAQAQTSSLLGGGSRNAVATATQTDTQQGVVGGLPATGEDTSRGGVGGVPADAVDPHSGDAGNANTNNVNGRGFGQRRNSTASHHGGGDDHQDPAQVKPEEDQNSTKLTFSQSAHQPEVEERSPTILSRVRNFVRRRDQDFFYEGDSKDLILGDGKSGTIMSVPRRILAKPFKGLVDPSRNFFKWATSELRENDHPYLASVTSATSSLLTLADSLSTTALGGVLGEKFYQGLERQKNDFGVKYKFEKFADDEDDLSDPNNPKKNLNGDEEYQKTQSKQLRSIISLCEDFLKKKEDPNKEAHLPNFFDVEYDGKKIDGKNILGFVERLDSSSKFLHQKRLRTFRGSNLFYDDDNERFFERLYQEYFLDRIEIEDEKEKGKKNYFWVPNERWNESRIDKDQNDPEKKRLKERFAQSQREFDDLYKDKFVSGEKKPVKYKDPEENKIWNSNSFTQKNGLSTRDFYESYTTEYKYNEHKNCGFTSLNAGDNQHLQYGDCRVDKLRYIDVKMQGNSSQRIFITKDGFEKIKEERAEIARLVGLYVEKELSENLKSAEEAAPEAQRDSINSNKPLLQKINDIQKKLDFTKFKTLENVQDFVKKSTSQSQLSTEIPKLPEGLKNYCLGVADQIMQQRFISGDYRVWKGDTADVDDLQDLSFVSVSRKDKNKAGDVEVRYGGNYSSELEYLNICIDNKNKIFRQLKFDKDPNNEGFKLAKSDKHFQAGNGFEMKEYNARNNYFSKAMWRHKLKTTKVNDNDKTIEVTKSKSIWDHAVAKHETRVVYDFRRGSGPQVEIDSVTRSAKIGKVRYRGGLPDYISRKGVGKIYDSVSEKYSRLTGNNNFDEEDTKGDEGLDLYIQLGDDNKLSFVVGRPSHENSDKKYAYDPRIHRDPQILTDSQIGSEKYEKLNHDDLIKIKANTGNGSAFIDAPFGPSKSLFGITEVSWLPIEALGTGTRDPLAKATLTAPGPSPYPISASVLHSGLVPGRS